MSTPHRFFLLTITNFPYLLERTRTYQQVQEINDPPPINDATPDPLPMLQFPLDAHEQILYDGLQFELREAIRAYLHRTARPYPVHIVFDMSDLDV